MESPIGSEIRMSPTRAMRRRRRVATLAALGAADFLLGAMYQTGVVKELPDVRSRHVDARAVMGSRAGYPFGVPDTPLALAFQGGLMALAVARGPRRHPAWDVALGVVSVAGGVGAVAYAAQMIRLKKLCLYCTFATAMSIATVPAAWPLMRAGWRALRDR